MRPLLTKAEAKAFKKRWQFVNAREMEEMRSTSIEVKWQQFNTLMRWAYEFGWTQRLAERDAAARERWIKIRKAMRGKEGKG